MTIAGYVDFEFNLPEALLAKLVQAFDGLDEAPLLPSVVGAIPDAQGVYQLLLEEDGKRKLVYIGKTDGDAGLCKRLSRHALKIQHRTGLKPELVFFRAVRVYVFTAVDLETQLIAYYGGNVDWNGSGFGSNDPGKERDTTFYKADHFDTKFPIDISRNLGFAVPKSGKAIDVLQALKTSLPYLLRFERRARGGVAHSDLTDTDIKIDGAKPLTAESVIAQVVRQLPSGWHATMLPSHVIIYKNDTRTFPSGRLIAKS